MKKTLPLLITIFFFTSYAPIHAADNFIDSILNFFSGNSSTYISKDPVLNINGDNSQYTNYSGNYDYTNRTGDEPSRMVSRGQHIEDIITNKYSTPDPSINERDDKILASLCNNQCQNYSSTADNCRPIRISEVAYFYLTQGKSTSYSLVDNRAVSKPFPSEVTDKLNNTYSGKITLAPTDCYPKLYDLITTTPKSNDSTQSPKNTTSSDQLTNTINTVVPDSVGKKPLPALGFFDSIANVFDGGNTAKVKENYFRENQMLQNFTPESQKETVSTDILQDNDSLRSNFKKNMTPQSWQEGTIDSDDGSIVYNNGQYNNVDASTYINGTEMYIFETPGGSRITQRYDLGIVDSSRLKEVPSEYRAGSLTRVDERIIPAYLAMIKAGRDSGIPVSELKLISGYRSVAQQQVLWDSYPANQRCDGTNHPCYVARPGSSPHHTGRAIDIVVNGGAGVAGISAQKASATFSWLIQNAPKFGFYNLETEPWHWEYNPSAN